MANINDFETKVNALMCLDKRTLAELVALHECLNKNKKWCPGVSDGNIMDILGMSEFFSINTTNISNHATDFAQTSTRDNNYIKTGTINAQA